VDYNSKNENFMEADPGTKPLTKKTFNNEQKENSNHLSNGRNVRESFRIRRPSIDVDTINRFLVESQFRFVLPCGVLLWVIFLFFRH
jgi:hypothetical protein